MNNRFSKLVQNFLTNYIIGECNYSMNTKDVQLHFIYY